MSDDFDLPDGWLESLEEAIIDDDVNAIDSPWIVVCTDLNTGFTTYSGPYGDGFRALAVAEWELREQRLAESYDLTFDVARLGHPSGLGAVAAATDTGPTTC